MSSRLDKKLGRVGILFGGCSAEREISLKSGKAVLNALRQTGINVVPVLLDEHPLAAIQAAELDLAFIALHGPGGEDGTMQALLSILGIPFTGSGVQASALAMDKLKSKYILQSCGVDTPKFEILLENCDWQAVLTRLGGAAFVKPAHEGSSIGMSKVASAEELEKAYHLARQYDRSVFAEELIVGSEYTVAILGDRCLPAIRLETDNPFYDYEAKYISNQTQYHCPCGLSEDREQQLQQLALQSFNALGCEGWGRVDFMADNSGNFYALEVNTVPGMTDHSLVPMAAAAAGLDFGSLCLNILELTVDKESH